MKLILFAALLALAGCANQPISNSPLTSIIPSNVASDLAAARSNADQAEAIGALPVGDPLVACLDSVVPNPACSSATPPAGCPPASQSFVPTNDGLVSLGTITYIRVQQAKSLGTASVSAQCEQLIGKAVVDAAQQTNSGAINALVLHH
jgi:hypothetical protein